jgi:CheY-like chemotaxis protein
MATVLQPAEPMSPPAPAHILVVEDNVGDYCLLREVLKDTPTLHVAVVENAVQALLYLSRRAPFAGVGVPDLVILDLQLPVFDGTLVLKTIKEEPRLRHIPVVMFTSSHLAEDQKRCVELGADDYHVKPSLWTEWVRTINTIIAVHLRFPPRQAATAPRRATTPPA